MEFQVVAMEICIGQHENLYRADMKIYIGQNGNLDRVGMEI
jgi:hypothetical protein